MKIEIKSRYTESVLFSHDVDENTLKISLLAALKAGADLCGANLCGANLRVADLGGANLDGEKILQNPIKMIGHQYWILITDSFMRIGCQRHTHQQWAEFDSKQIDDMASHATEFWNQWDEVLLAMCKTHSDKVKK